MKQLILSIISIFVLFSSCKTVGEFELKPSNLETVMALKKILDSSTFKAIKKLNNINDGSLEKALPSEVGAVLKTLKTVGYGEEVEKMTKSIGQVSTLVLGESEEIIGEAISELKFTDAVAVVLGGEDATTNVL